MQLRREDAERVALAGGEPARELVLRLVDEVADLGERLEKLERALGRTPSIARCRRPVIGGRDPSARRVSAQSASRVSNPVTRARRAS